MGLWQCDVEGVRAKLLRFSAFPFRAGAETGQPPELDGVGVPCLRWNWTSDLLQAHDKYRPNIGPFNITIEAGLSCTLESFL